jgi:hypothetical protein
MRHYAEGQLSNQIMNHGHLRYVQDRYGDAVDGIPVQFAGYGDQRLKHGPP